MKRVGTGCWRLGWLLLCAGCSDDLAGQSLCVPGELVECLCEDEAQGIRQCRDDGLFEECSCEGEAEDAGEDSQPPASDDAGMSGDPPGGEPDPGQEPPTEPTPADAGGDPPGPTEPTPGEPTPGEPPPEGSVWAPCERDEQCQGSLQCAGNQGRGFGGSPVGYCSNRCNNRRQCMSPNSGSVEVICSPLSTLCELGDCERDACPAGMICQELVTPFGSAFECAYPAE